MAKRGRPKLMYCHRGHGPWPERYANGLCKACGPARRGLPPMTPRNEEIVAAVAAGATLRAVGERFGITHQRVSQICGTTPKLPAAVVFQAILDSGVEIASLAHQYAADYGVTYRAARTLLTELAWRPTCHFATADRVLTLIGATHLLEETA